MGREMQLRASTGWVAVALLLGAACNAFDAPAADDSFSDVAPTTSPDKPRPMPQPSLGVGGSLTLPTMPVTNYDLGAECDLRRGVAADGRGLIVNDPEVLVAFSLERTLRQIAATAHVTLTPEQLLQRLFDTENTTADGVFADVRHCDDPQNSAFFLAKAVDCPRAEGRLAQSTSMLTEGAADFFAPVALVNRFDLAPSDLRTCGEYRIVYAKQSGRSDPQDRVLLIFEAALLNPSLSLSGCRAAAELWAGLPLVDAPTQKERLSAFYFDGVGQLPPAISVAHLGANGGDCRYAGQCGQIRVGQSMQAPFQYRQFTLHGTLGNDPEQPNQLDILPTADSQSPRPQLWDLPSTDLGASSFRQELLSSVGDLSKANPAQLRMGLRSGSDAGESAVSGAARPNFAERLAKSPAADAMNLASDLTRYLEPDVACPSDDPLTSDSIVERVTALTCAGCHAPEQVLAPGRKLGCGSVWPLSLGETHVNERGELSAALTDVFLPYRADVLSTFLQACDLEKVQANLQPVPREVHGECFPPGTPITLANGSHKPIEQVEPSDWVLTFDSATHTPVPAQVTARIVRQDAQRFVRINDALVATDNHPFFTDTGWVRAMDLQVGATLLSLTDARAATPSGLDVRPARVTQLTLEGGSGLTYNLHVDGHHGYFAGGMLVHDRP
jgi:hypothetical protein